MVVISLRELCLREIARNVDGLSNVGDVPLDILRPSLAAVSAGKLLDLERINGWNDQSLWRDLVLRDFASAAPRNATDWRSTYSNLERQKRDKLSSVRAKLKTMYSGHDAKKEAKQARSLEALPVRKGHTNRTVSGGVNSKRKAHPLFAKSLKQAKMAMRS